MRYTTDCNSPAAGEVTRMATSCPHRLTYQVLKHKDIASLRIEYSEEPTKVVSELTAEYDLLVLGTPKKDTWTTMLFGTGKDEFAVNSACSVLRLTVKD